MLTHTQRGRERERERESFIKFVTDTMTIIINYIKNVHFNICT